MSDLAPDRDAVGSDPGVARVVTPIRWSRVGPLAVVASLVLAFALAGPRFWHSVRSDPTAAVAVEALPSTTQAALGSQLPPEKALKPQAGQVAVLGRFAARDPFAAPASVKGATAQARATKPAAGAPALVTPASTATAGVASAAPDSSPVTVPATSPATNPAVAPGVGPATTPADAQVAAATAGLPAADPAASTVTVSVNGVAEQVAVKGLFPAADPIFRLAALGATSVQISVAGAATATGDQTVTLTQGRSLTLLDTASGARYELRLVATPASPAATTLP